MSLSENQDLVASIRVQSSDPDGGIASFMIESFKEGRLEVQMEAAGGGFCFRCVSGGDGDGGGQAAGGRDAEDARTSYDTMNALLLNLAPSAQQAFHAKLFAKLSALPS